MKEKNLFIIAGCNGAGKTTASFTILSEILDCKEFVNADEIAKGISPFQPEKVAFEAARIMLSRINELLKSKENFAFETTLATKSYKEKITTAYKNGFITTLLFFWLKNIDLAKERVKTRVLEGGHNIEPDIIERRYVNGIINLFDIYIPLVNETFIFDNTELKPVLIAEKKKNSLIKVIDVYKFNEMKKKHENRS